MGVAIGGRPGSPFVDDTTSRRRGGGLPRQESTTTILPEPTTFFEVWIRVYSLSAALKTVY